MITINPPKVVPYAPSNQPVATVRIRCPYKDAATGIAQVIVSLYDAKNTQININQGGLSEPWDKAAQAAFLATPALAGELQCALEERAILPYLAAAYGLTPGAPAPAAKK